MVYRKGALGGRVSALEERHPTVSDKMNFKMNLVTNGFRKRCSKLFDIEMMCMLEFYVFTMFYDIEFKLQA